MSGTNGHKSRPVIKLQPFEFELFNRKLKENYGQLEDGKPYFRLVWSEDAFEKRWMTHTNEGFALLQPEVREVRKYRPHTVDRYVLEGLQEIPPNVETDLVGLVSYEPVWTFQDKNQEYLIPRWDAISLILETIKMNMEGRRMEIPEELIRGTKEGKTVEEEIQLRKEGIAKIYESLFGEDTPISDGLRRGNAIIVPGKEKEN